MKQQIILMSLLTALVMMAGGCGKPEYEPSPYVDTVLATPEGRPAEDETGYLLWTEFSAMDLS